MESFKEADHITTPEQLDVPAVARSLQQCEHSTRLSGCSILSEDKEHRVDDPTLSTRPTILCDISELSGQKPTTMLTSADLKVLDEVAEDLLKAAVQRSLNLPPLSLGPSDERSSSVSSGDSSIASQQPEAPRIFVKSVLDKLLEFDEVASEIRNANTKYGKHLPPLPRCFSSAPEVEDLPPITRHSEDGDCVAPSLLGNNVQQTTTAINQLPPDVLEVKRLIQTEEYEEAVQSTAIDEAKNDGDCVAPSLLANSVQQTTTANNQLPLDVDCEPDVLEVKSVTQSDEIEKTVQSTTIDVAKSVGDELEPSVTTATVKSAAAAEQPLQDRRRPSIMSALGNRLLKVGRLLFCCCYRPNNND